MVEFSRFIQAIDSHTAGEPTRVVTGGLPNIPGRTMLEKRAWLRENLDQLRTGLILEPRGHAAIILAYLTPPVSDAADVGVVFANDVGYLNMCGHGTIGVATVLVSTGMVEACEPETRVVLDTPAGRVETRVHVDDGRPVAVTMRNVPAFLHERDLRLDVPGHGELAVDIAYGGNWFALVPQEQVGIPIEMQHLDRLIACADAVRRAVHDAGVTGFDPHTGERQPVDHVEIFAPREVSEGVGARTMTLCPGMEYDRSPCGTGTSAKLAAMLARGKLAVGEPLHNQSVTGTGFVGTVVEEKVVDGRTVVIPEVRGSAYITGFQQFVFDPEDPLRFGLSSS